MVWVVARIDAQAGCIHTYLAVVTLTRPRKQ